MMFSVPWVSALMPPAFPGGPREGASQEGQRGKGVEEEAEEEGERGPE